MLRNISPRLEETCCIVIYFLEGGVVETLKTLKAYDGLRQFNVKMSQLS